MGPATNWKANKNKFGSAIFIIGPDEKQIKIKLILLVEPNIKNENHWYIKLILELKQTLISIIKFHSHTTLISYFIQFYFSLLNQTYTK